MNRIELKLSSNLIESFSSLPNRPALVLMYSVKMYVKRTLFSGSEEMRVLRVVVMNNRGLRTEAGEGDYMYCLRPYFDRSVNPLMPMH